MDICIQIFVCPQHLSATSQCISIITEPKTKDKIWNWKDTSEISESTKTNELFTTLKILPGTMNDTYNGVKVSSICIELYWYTPPEILHFADPENC